LAKVELLNLLSALSEPFGLASALIDTEKTAFGGSRNDLIFPYLGSSAAG
jgi:hypothetical protein